MTVTGRNKALLATALRRRVRWGLLVAVGGEAGATESSKSAHHTTGVPRCGAGLLLAGALFLSACGKSSDERRVEVVKCSSFVQAFGWTQLSGGPARTFTDSLKPLMAGHPAQDDFKLAAIMQLGDKLAPSLDQVRATSAATDGAQAWVKQYGAKDSKAIVDFLDGCVGNYDELVRSTR